MICYDMICYYMIYDVILYDGGQRRDRQEACET